MDDNTRAKMHPGGQYKYWAFISYSSKNRKWGEWLHKRLETYPIPAEFQQFQLFDGAVLGKNLRPVFRDRDELAGSSDLGPAIDKALSESRYLIVLCSPNAARSNWVNKEIEDFKKLGGEQRILALILKGEPNASGNPGADPDQECFPQALRYPVEPLAGDLRKDGDGKERGFLKILAGMAQLDFDHLYRRHERAVQRRRARLAVAAVALIALLSGLTAFAIMQRGLAMEREEEANTQRGVAVKRQAEAEEQRKRAEDATAKAIASERETKMALAENDYELAQLNRWKGDYRRAMAHLERCLRNAPAHPFAGDLAWAFLTSEKLLFSRPVRTLPKQRLSSAFSRDGKSLVWVSESGWIEKLALDPDAKPERLAQLPDWKQDKESRVTSKYEPSLSRLHIVLTDGDGAGIRYEIDVENAKLVKNEPFETAGAVEIGRALNMLHDKAPVDELTLITTSVAEAVKQAPSTEAYYGYGRAIVATHPLLELVSGYYRQCESFEDLLWIYGGGTARQETHLIFFQSGKAGAVAGAPVTRAVFSRKNDLLLVERESYYGNPILDWIDLAAPGDDPYANASRTVYHGRVGSRGGFLIDPSESQIVLAVNNRCFLFGAAMDERPSRTVEDESLGDLVDQLRGELLGMVDVDAIHFDPQTRTVLAACRAGLWKVSLPEANRIVIEKSPWDSFGDGPDKLDEPIPLVFPEEPENARSLGDRSEHNRLAELLASKSLLSRSNGPLFTEHTSGERETRIIDIGDDWAAREPTSRICSVSPDFRHVLNRGHWGKYSRLSKGKQIAATQGPTAKAAFLWPLYPSDEQSPVWLPDFLQALNGMELDEDGILVESTAKEGALLGPPPADQGSDLSLDWASLAVRYGAHIPAEPTTD